MEQIAEYASTTKRMGFTTSAIKQRSNMAVLEQVYLTIRQHEAGLNLDKLPPLLAMQRLTEASFDYPIFPDFMRLVCGENLMHGRYISQSFRIKALNPSALNVLEGVLFGGSESEQQSIARNRQLVVDATLSAPGLSQALSMAEEYAGFPRRQMDVGDEKVSSILVWCHAAWHGPRLDAA